MISVKYYPFTVLFEKLCLFSFVFKTVNIPLTSVKSVALILVVVFLLLGRVVGYRMMVSKM